jgi:hypothetical protein
MRTTRLSRFESVAREGYSDATHPLVIFHPLSVRAAQPGQFVIVMPLDGGTTTRTQQTCVV